MGAAGARLRSPGAASARSRVSDRRAGSSACITGVSVGLATTSTDAVELSAPLHVLWGSPLRRRVALQWNRAAPQRGRLVARALRRCLRMSDRPPRKLLCGQRNDRHDCRTRWVHSQERDIRPRFFSQLSVGEGQSRSECDKDCRQASSIGLAPPERRSSIDHLLKVTVRQMIQLSARGERSEDEADRRFHHTTHRFAPADSTGDTARDGVCRGDRSAPRPWPPAWSFACEPSP